MKPLEITYLIDLHGNVTVEVQNGDGQNCIEATKPYEEALGDSDPDRQMKPEGSLLRFTATSTSQTIQL